MIRRLLAVCLFAVVAVVAPTLLTNSPPYAAAQAVRHELAPPVARVAPTVYEEFGQRRIDNYAWLRQRNDPQVLAYLAAENTYAASRLGRLKPLVDEISAELRDRFGAADFDVPYLMDGYRYQRRVPAGAPYSVIVRSKGEGPEEIVLDGNALAAGHAHFRLNRWTVSQDGTRVAFAVDFTGNRTHRLFVRTISTGEVVDQRIHDSDGDLALAADGKTLFY